jgi:hypothetical protein
VQVASRPVAEFASPDCDISFQQLRCHLAI